MFFFAFGPRLLVLRSGDSSHLEVFNFDSSHICLKDSRSCCLRLLLSSEFPSGILNMILFSLRSFRWVISCEVSSLLFSSSVPFFDICSLNFSTSRVFELSIDFFIYVTSLRKPLIMSSPFCQV